MLKDLTELPPLADYLRRIGASARSMRTAVVRETRGKYWADLAVIKLDSKTGEISVKSGDDEDADHYAPTEDEARDIKKACVNAEWPESASLPPRHHCRDRLPASLPGELTGIDEEAIFPFHDCEGRVVMLQRRATKDEEAAGAPKYSPWSPWTDGEWRQMEPEGPLPLFGLSTIGDQTTVFIHEGAKAARAVHRLITPQTDHEREALAAHPWGQELQGAAHLGWIGGALSPARTDWSVLKKMGVTRAYIVSDNDEPGKCAVPRISRELRVPTFHVEFTDEWPVSFDLADPFPSKMYCDGRYVGPSFRALLEPATWATDLHLPERGGKPIPYLREHFKAQWAYADEPELFICMADTRIIRSPENLSRKLVKFSHSPGTARLLLRDCDHVTKPAYAPDRGQGTITLRDQRAFNVFRPSDVKPLPGNVDLWTGFLAYLFPKPEERKQVERWAATLIARPEIRMHYGLLLVSETQGVGKGIFASQVLAPLVGQHNVGFPSEHDISDSAFNDWMTHKRLVVVGEIYQGHSFKAYNRLKGVITDADFEVNKKHQTAYRIDNWCHVVAMSNSRKALKVENTDRRWFYPQVQENPWSRAEFADFVAWLKSGGLQNIAHWASQNGEYVSTGEQPPMTARKTELIEESQAEELRWVQDYCAGRIADEESFIISTDIAFDYARKVMGQPIYSSKLDMGKQMVAAGMVQLKGDENRVQHENKRHNLFMSPAAVEELAVAQAAAFPVKESPSPETPKARRNKWLREKLMGTQAELKQARTW